MTIRFQQLPGSPIPAYSDFSWDASRKLVKSRNLVTGFQAIQLYN